MKIICLIKFIPDVDNFIYDYDKNVLVRENMDLILNPDDACALAYALKLKSNNPEIFIEILSMAPLSTSTHIKELLRLGIDKASIISDKLFAGSDTYVTSEIIYKYLKSSNFNLILTGTHSLDGDTSHIPSQIAELLNINQIASIRTIEDIDFTKKTATLIIEQDNETSTFEVELPAILSLEKESKYKLPFVKYANLNLNVDDKLDIITNNELNIDENELGLKGSLTKVVKTYIKKLEKQKCVVVENDEKGIETVFEFLKEKGYV